MAARAGDMHRFVTINNEISHPRTQIILQIISSSYAMAKRVRIVARTGVQASAMPRGQVGVVDQSVPGSTWTAKNLLESAS